MKEWNLIKKNILKNEKQTIPHTQNRGKIDTSPRVIVVQSLVFSKDFHWPVMKGEIIVVFVPWCFCFLKVGHLQCTASWN